MGQSLPRASRDCGPPLSFHLEPGLLNERYAHPHRRGRVARFSFQTAEMKSKPNDDITVGLRGCLPPGGGHRSFTFVLAVGLALTGHFWLKQTHYPWKSLSCFCPDQTSSSSLFLFVVFLFFFFQGRVSCGPGWSRTCFVALNSLIILAPPTKCWGFQVSDTMPCRQDTL